MTRFRVRPSGPFHGQVVISGASKNSGTKQMAAALLASGVTTLRNVPHVSDLDVMVDVLRAVGAGIELRDDEVHIDARGELNPVAPYELVTRMRASFNVLGPLLARCGHARVALPGGDLIGSRKVDMHLRGLETMGAQIDVEHGFVVARAPRLAGARVMLEFPSVGATENLMCAAVLAKGATVIENAAREPEVTDLAAYLDRMGAQVIGAGTSSIEVEGVDELVAVDSEIMADRIEAGTLLMACGMVGGEIELVGTRLEHIEIIAMKLCEMGMRVSQTPDGVWARSAGRLRAVDIATLPHPGFATDFMPLAVALTSVADGSAIITENIFDGRFQFADELARMGADVRTEGRHAIVRGVARLSGAPVSASDVRAGAALVLAGLVADGETIVHGGEHVDRGYHDLARALRTLGADVVRIA
ncbi:MAG: UDP-N-acetylglucosamine 1-carboxyvinyltransferase [Actinomycetota bacterium]